MLNFGVIPDGMVIDHINRNPSDNRIANLRCVPQSMNLTNVPVRSHSKTGHKYIAQDKRTGNWMVRIARVSYGTFPTLEEALEVRDLLLMGI